ncbi:MAG TPA: HAD-IIA family hydrolase [Actinomycetales bacterium]|nr:HAD-IIA family hydrolase [Actinomycetales bacterium]
MDLDGVMYAGQEPIPNAAEGARRARELGLRLMFVTNNASRPAGQVADHLSALDIPTEPEDVYTAAMAGAELAVSRHGRGARILAIGGAGLFEAVEAAGLTRVTSADDQPVAVVQGLDRSIGWAELSEAALAVGGGADFIATNMDSTLPMERGFAIGNGSLVAAVINATGKQPVSAGKPEPEIYRLATQRVGGHRPIAVGDRLNTDIRGAVASGMPSLHVLTGISGAREVVTAVPEERPSYLGLDLLDLTEPHPAVTREGEWTACRSARATTSDGVPVLGREGGEFRLTQRATVTLDEYRALAVAAWSTAGVDVPELEVTR